MTVRWEICTRARREASRERKPEVIVTDCAPKSFNQAREVSSRATRKKRQKKRAITDKKIFVREDAFACKLLSDLT
ncbi:hypothetical protein QLX08_001499 [Tetragonisca angustula]|uniref:Uncharacterized protein n=1 Tax=Tetragonisca angustula TaxID=166442 RepID=A0AAW1AHG4_9HYME